LKDLLLASLSGVLLVASFPKVDLGILAWFALVPLLVALDGKGLKDAFLLSSLAGWVFLGAVLWGISSGSVAALRPIHFLLLGAYSLYIGVSGGSASIGFVRGRGSPAPLLLRGFPGPRQPINVERLVSRIFENVLFRKQRGR